MTFITITLKENLMLNGYLQTQRVKPMQLKQMMFMKIFMKINVCLIFVITQKIQNFMILRV